MAMFKRLGAVITLISAAVSLTGCGSNTQGQPAMGMGPTHETSVRVESVKQRQINDASSFMGTLKSRHSSILRPRVSGVVSRILAEPGMLVKAGAPLVEIDLQKQKATLDSTEAASEESSADRETAVQTLKSLEASLRSKESNLRFAKSQERRYGLLASQGAVSTESAENYSTARKVAEADVQNVQAQIEAQKSAVAKFERMIKQTSATAQEKKVQLQYYTIGAPFTGTVGDIPIRIGEYVDSNTKVTTVTENQPLEVYVSVPAEKASRLKLNMPVELTDSDGKVMGAAQIMFISPSVDDQSQSVLVKALYANADGRLRSNQAVGARVIWARQPGLLIPTFAVAHISGQDFVFVAEKSDKGLVAKQKAVELGPINDNAYVVNTGLHPGDNVVVSGIQNLIDGMPISAQTAVSGR